jgi:hypothetical protein
MVELFGRGNCLLNGSQEKKEARMRSRCMGEEIEKRRRKRRRRRKKKKRRKKRRG